MAESSSGQDTRKETSQTDEYFVQGNYPPGLVVPPRHYFTQHLYYPYVNPYSHLTESNGNLSIHGYGSDGRPKFRRSRTIFSPEQLDILEEHFAKYKYPDVKRRRTIADEVGLPEERVQVWFQNRRAKNKRQADQQVKLQKLVDEAISTSANNEQQHLQSTRRNFDHDVTVSDQNATEYLRCTLRRPCFQDKETEKEDGGTFPGTETKIPRLKGPEIVNQKDSRDLHPNCCTGSREIVFREDRNNTNSKTVEHSVSSHNMWTQSSTSAFDSTEAQVVIQNIDQDLLFKVANILSASNDATTLISEWSRTPNKAHTNNLEEQLRHFADHHQQVLLARGHTTTSSANHKTQEKTGN